MRRHSDHTTTAPNDHRFGNAAVAGSLVATAAVVGGLASRPDDAWYLRLNKPTWQPPSSAFPVAWTALYATIAVASTAALNELDRRGDAEQAASFRRALATNLAVNGAWSWVFFRAHNLGAATAGAAVLAASSLGLARRAGRVKPGLGALLAPYAAWTAFATVLAGTVWWLNRNND